jgi:hypothetical protein
MPPDLPLNPGSVQLRRIVLTPLNGGHRIGVLALGPSAQTLLEPLCRHERAEVLALDAALGSIEQALDGLDDVLVLLDSHQTFELHLMQRLVVLAVASGKLTAVLVPPGAAGPELSGPAPHLSADPAWLRPWQQTGAWLLPQAGLAQLQALSRALLQLRAERMVLHVDAEALHEVIGAGGIRIAAVQSTMTGSDWGERVVQELVAQIGLAPDQLRSSKGLVLMLRGSPELVSLSSLRPVLKALCKLSNEQAEVRFGAVADLMLPQQIELILLAPADRSGRRGA